MESVTKAYYAIIPANIRYDSNIPPNAKLLYGEITALCNEKGYCWATNDYFAKLYNVSKTSISKWISCLIDNGYIARKFEYKDGTKEIQTRFLSLLNTPIEEKLNTPLTKVNDGIEEKLNTPIEEKLKDNNTVFNNTINNTTNTYMCAFEELWSVYPRKKEKAKAYKCYQARLKDGYSEQDIMSATKAYAAECRKNKTEEKYIKLAATFLGPNTPFVDYIAKEVIESGNGSNQTNEPDPYDIVSLVQRGKQNVPEL